MHHPHRCARSRRPQQVAEPTQRVKRCADHRPCQPAELCAAARRGRAAPGVGETTYLAGAPELLLLSQALQGARHSTLRTDTPSVNDQAWYPPDNGEPGANHKHVGRTQAHDIGRYELGRSRRSEAMMAVLSGAAFSRACASVIQPRGSPRRGVTHARRTSTTDRTMITAATSSSTTIVNHKSRELANTPHSSFPGSGDAPRPGAIGRSIRKDGAYAGGGHGPGRRAGVPGGAEVRWREPGARLRDLSGDGAVDRAWHSRPRSRRPSSSGQGSTSASRSPSSPPEARSPGQPGMAQRRVGCCVLVLGYAAAQA